MIEKENMSQEIKSFASVAVEVMISMSGNKTVMHICKTVVHTVDVDWLRASFWYFGTSWYFVASLATVVVLKAVTVVSRIKLAFNINIFYKMQNEEKNSEIESRIYF